MYPKALCVHLIAPIIIFRREPMHIHTMGKLPSRTLQTSLYVHHSNAVLKQKSHFGYALPIYEIHITAWKFPRNCYISTKLIKSTKLVNFNEQVYSKIHINIIAGSSIWGNPTYPSNTKRDCIHTLEILQRTKLINLRGAPGNHCTCTCAPHPL